MDYSVWSQIQTSTYTGFKIRFESSILKSDTHTVFRLKISIIFQSFVISFYKTESLLHGLEWAAGSIGFHLKADKTEYICFSQRVDISTLSGGSLKLVDKFTYIGSSISSAENDINMQLAKTAIGIDRLSVI